MTRALPLLALSLAACGQTDARPTWYRDVEPLVYRSCSSCHVEGGIGGHDWTSYDEAAEYASLIALYVDEGDMPLPAADPECRDYQGSHRMTLTDDERETFVRWFEAGALLGDPADRTPGLAPVDLSLPGTDTRLEPPVAHEVTVGSDGNEYFCQVLDNPFTEPTWVTGIDVDLDQRSVVHHMLLAVDLGGDAGIEYGAAPGETAFPCRTPVVESDWLLLHAWTPGMEPVTFGAGQGLLVEPGQQLVLQMHYFADADAPAKTDRSAYALRTTTTPQQDVYMAVIGPSGFRIPAHDAAYSASEEVPNDLGAPLQILGAFPHMHLLGSHYRAWVGADADRECLLDGRYDFDHQMTYMFTEPVPWNRNQPLGFECTWDNSADNPNQYNDPPRDVTYGEGTNEEMCFLLFYVTEA